MNALNTRTAEVAFSCMPTAAGELFDFRSGAHPTVVAGWSGSRLETDPNGTHFGFVYRGRAKVDCASGEFELGAGMYFAAPGAATVEGAGAGFVASSIGYRGLFQIGGPVEGTGRLRYIDGCSDSLLVAPVMRGDPCLNLLHVPPHTDQTAHTHPSLRAGMIVDGAGLCRTRDGDFPLTPGLVFVIRTGGLHSFHTRERALSIIAWHPDSDFGPTHEEHPMLNRTFVGGQPVNLNRGRQ